MTDLLSLKYYDIFYKLMALAFRIIAFCLILEVIELFINKLAVLNYFTLMCLFVKTLLYNR